MGPRIGRQHAAREYMVYIDIYLAMSMCRSRGPLLCLARSGDLGICRLAYICHRG